MTQPMTSGYQPTLLSASVSGLVTLWMMSFAGEIYGDLDGEGRLYLFRALAWLVPPFALSCVSLGIQYAFADYLSPLAKGLINAFMPSVVFITLIFCAFEVRLILLQDAINQTHDMNIALAFLLSSWSIVVIAMFTHTILHRRRRQS